MHFNKATFHLTIWILGLLLLVNTTHAQDTNTFLFGNDTLQAGSDIYKQLKAIRKNSKDAPKVERYFFDAREYQKTKDGSALDVLNNLSSVRVGKGRKNKRDLDLSTLDSLIVLENNNIINGSVNSYLSKLPDHAVEYIEVIAFSKEKAKTGIVNIKTRDNYADGLNPRFHIQGGTAMDVLMNMPSINKTEYSFKLAYNGIPGFNLMIDGQLIQADIENLLKQIPASNIQDIQILPLPSAKYDTNGGAGIINITTKRDTVDSLSVQINIHAGNSLNTPFEADKKTPNYGGDFLVRNVKNKWNYQVGGLFHNVNNTSLRIRPAWSSVNELNADSHIIDRDPPYANLYSKYHSDDYDDYDMPEHYMDYEMTSESEQLIEEQKYLLNLKGNYSPNNHKTFEYSIYGGGNSRYRTTNSLYGLFDTDTYNKIDTPAKFISYKMNKNQAEYTNNNNKRDDSYFLLGTIGYKHTYPNQSHLSLNGSYHFLSKNNILQSTDNRIVNTIIRDIDTGFFEWHTADIKNSIDAFFQENIDKKSLSNTLNTRIDYKVRPFRIGILEVGAQIKHLSQSDKTTYHWTNQKDRKELDTVNSGEANISRNTYSIYGQLSGQKGGLTYNLGGRFEYLSRYLEINDLESNKAEKSTISKAIFYPSLYLKYNITKRFDVEANYLKRMVEPTLNQLNPLRERDHFTELYQGNPNIIFSTVDIKNLKFNYKFGKNSVFIKVGTYDIHEDNYRINVIRHYKNNYKVWALTSHDEFITVTGTNGNVHSDIKTIQKRISEVGVILQPLKKWRLFLNYQTGYPSWRVNNKIDITPTLNTEFILSHYSYDLNNRHSDFPLIQKLQSTIRLKKTLKKGKYSCMLQWSNISFKNSDNNIRLMAETFYYLMVPESNILMLNLTYNFNK